MDLQSSSLLFTTLLISSLIAGGQCRGKTEQASTPPRGWNSYDSFIWTISEAEFLENAQLVAQRLLPHGYKYVVVDYLWYRRKVKGAYVDSLGFDVIDEWGRMVPDPDRWPSSSGGRGFSEVAAKVHGMGLKFGIHVMRGVSTQAFNANTPILDVATGKAYEESGRQWFAKDIGIKERTCPWMQNGFMSVNTKLGAGRAFLRSLHQQYAEWGVDFVKHDCVFGEDFDLDEINYVSQVLTEAKNPIVYSLSPGSTASPSLAKQISGIVNMYRVTGDDWDTWGDVAAHFDVSRDFAAARMIGAKGLRGKSWPDLDMLPLGWLSSQGTNDGPHRSSNLTRDEQRSQLTLWAFAKSPLMFGGDMRKLDDETFRLISNPTLLKINAFSSNNKEFPHVSSKKDGVLRDLDRPSISELPILSLSSCFDDKARGWYAKAVEGDLEHICWSGSSTVSSEKPFCLYKRSPLLFSDEYVVDKKRYDGTTHLFKTRKAAVCLGGSSNKRLTSKELKRGSFSTCKWDANQMWELNYNGALRNSYSGLCASVRTVRAESGPDVAHAWIATTRRGREVYVALFNLDSQKALLSMNTGDLAKALPGKKLDSCRCREEWSGKDFGVVKGSLSTEVESHGCAVFILNCS